MNNLASLLGSENPEEAEKMFRNMLSLYQETFGENDPDLLWGMNDLALFLSDHGRDEEASELFRIVFQKCDTGLGSEHYHTLTLMRNLSSCLLNIGKYEEAETLSRNALIVSQKKNGLYGCESLLCLLDLGCALYTQGKYSEVEELLQPCNEVQAKNRKILELVVGCVFVLNLALNEQIKFKESENALQRLYGLYVQELGNRNCTAVTIMNRIAIAKEFQKEYAKAEDLYMKAIEIIEVISVGDKGCKLSL